MLFWICFFNAVVSFCAWLWEKHPYFVMCFIKVTDKYDKARVIYIKNQWLSQWFIDMDPHGSKDSCNMIWAAETNKKHEPLFEIIRILCVAVDPYQSWQCHHCWWRPRHKEADCQLSFELFHWSAVWAAATWLAESDKIGRWNRCCPASQDGRLLLVFCQEREVND